MSIDDFDFDLLDLSAETPAAGPSFLESLLEEERVRCVDWEFPSVASSLIAFDKDESPPFVGCLRCWFCWESEKLKSFAGMIGD